MTMTRLLKLAGVLCLLVSLAAFAQDAPQSSVPVPPISGAGSDGPEGDRPFSALRYDSTSGTGFVSSSFLSTHVGLSYLYDSYANDSAGSPNGSLTLVHRARANDTEIDYNGGGTIHSQDSGINTQYHRLAASETFHGALWRVTLADQSSYLPNSAYGSSAFGGLSPQLIQLLELLFPNQSFIQQGGQQYMNAVILNADRSLSRKFSMHGAFVYSLMKYIDSGLIGLHAYQGSGGLTRQFGRRDSIAADYSWGLTDFTGSTSMQSNKLIVKYTHPFRNRAVLELSGGPEAVSLRSPGQPDKNRMLVDGAASFTWQTSRLDASLSYSHNSGSGSGLLQGVEMHSVTASVRHRLGRVWTVGLYDGFNNVNQLSSLLSTGTPFSYSSAHSGVSVRRNMGRTMTFNLKYDFQYQIESQRAIPDTTYRRNQVLAGFTFNLHPISL